MSDNGQEDKSNNSETEVLSSTTPVTTSPTSLKRPIHEVCLSMSYWPANSWLTCFIETFYFIDWMCMRACRPKALTWLERRDTPWVALTMSCRVVNGVLHWNVWEKAHRTRSIRGWICAIEWGGRGGHSSPPPALQCNLLSFLFYAVFSLFSCSSCLAIDICRQRSEKRARDGSCSCLVWSKVWIKSYWRESNTFVSFYLEFPLNLSRICSQFLR